MHNTFAQQNDVFAEDAILENSEGPINNVHRIRKRIYSGILEGKFIALHENYEPCLWKWLLFVDSNDCAIKFENL